MIIGYISGQSLKIQAPVVVSDSINYLTAQFFFQTEDWRNLKKWAHFKQGDKVYDFALENDRIEKDEHLNLSAGEWEIYLHGNEFADGEVVERITTEIVKMTVNKSGVLEGEPFAEQPASEVERLNAKLDKFLETGIGGKVSSVNGKDGDVVLTAEDVGALPANTEIPTVPQNVSEFKNDAKYQTEADVTKVKNELSAEIKKKQDPIAKYVSAVNGMSGDVVLSAADVKALPDSTVIPIVPKNVSEFQNDANYATKTFVQETVNGKNIAFVFNSVSDLDTWLSNAENVSRLKTGDVFFIRDTGVPDYWWDGENQTKQIMETTKVDLAEYALKTEVPVKTSDLQNDSDFATNASVDTKLGGYQPKLSEYVHTVNGKSGAVNLNASDVGALPSTTQIPVVPTNVSAFENDAQYATENAVNAVYDYIQNNIKEQIYTIPVTLELTDDNRDLYTSLPDGVYDEILQAHNAGKVILANCTVAFPGDDSSESLDLRSTVFCVVKDAEGNVERFASYFVFYDEWTSIYQYTVNVSSSGYWWGKSKFLSPADRVHRGTPLLQETLDTDISTYYTTARAVHQVVKGLRDELLAKSAVGQANGVASLDENGLIPSAQLPPSSGGGESETEIFSVPIKIGASGFELDGVTYAEIMTAFSSGKRILAKANIPAAAGMGFSGDFIIPMTYLDGANNNFVFSFTTGCKNVEVYISSSDEVSAHIRELQEAGTGGSTEQLVYRFHFEAATDGTFAGVMVSADEIAKAKSVLENGGYVFATAYRNNVGLFFYSCAIIQDALILFNAHVDAAGITLVNAGDIWIANGVAG